MRLGSGGGHYDRLLAALAPEAITVGLAYSFQLLDGFREEPLIGGSISLLPSPPSIRSGVCARAGPEARTDKGGTPRWIDSIAAILGFVVGGAVVSVLMADAATYRAPSIIEAARAQAEELVREAQTRSELTVKEAEVKAKDLMVGARADAEREMRERRRELAALESKLQSREETFEKRQEAFERREGRSQPPRPEPRDPREKSHRKEGRASGADRRSPRASSKRSPA